MSARRTRIKQFTCPGCGSGVLIKRDIGLAVTMQGGKVVEDPDGGGYQCPLCGAAFMITSEGINRIGSRMPKPSEEKTREEKREQERRGQRQTHPDADDVDFGGKEPE